MPTLQVTRTANAAISFSYQPVAIFLGGTSGIGEAMARAFARHTHGNSRIIIIGRNRAVAEATIAAFPSPAAGPRPAHEFVECDVTLMKNVRQTAANLVGRLPKVNFLVMSPGFLSLDGREETTEGIDRRMAVRYYGRWRMLYDLMPLLRKAKDAGEEAKALTVMTAGAGKPIDLDDLALKKSYGVSTAMAATVTYNDLMIEAFAAKNPDMAFHHTHPGIVRTDITKGLNTHWAMWLASPLISGFVRMAGVSADDCAEYMFYPLYHRERGAFRSNSRGDDIGNQGLYTSEEARQRLWEHTLQVTDI